LVVLQSKLGKWGWLVEKLQMKDTPAAQTAEGMAAGEQSELENLYGVLDSLRAENELLENRNLELLEEMNALRLLNDRDKENITKYTLSDFAGDMVLVADNIRRSIEAVPKEQLDAIPALNSLVEGFEVTERSLLTALSRYQVTRFDPLGEPFNPHLHEAKFTVSAPDLPSNTVVQVIHAGFMMGERLLRPAGVAVSQIGAAAQPEDGAAADDRIVPSLPGATGPGRDAQQAGVPGRRTSILHKPVIPAEEDTPRERAEDAFDYIRESGRNGPSLPGREAAYEAMEISLTGLAQAIEDPQERTKAVNRAFEAKDYAEAARLQERTAAAVRRAETAAEGKPGDGTLDALLSLSWYQLLAGQYDAVIETADQAAAIRDDYISIDANRAHALMLKGAADEAKFLYNKHRGMETRNKKIWDHEILDDFAELEQENINHTLMNKIREAWIEKD
jgi:molecular chaperone GrpE